MISMTFEKTNGPPFKKMVQRGCSLQRAFSGRAFNLSFTVVLFFPAMQLQNPWPKTPPPEEMLGKISRQHFAVRIFRAAPFCREGQERAQVIR